MKKRIQLGKVNMVLLTVFLLIFMFAGCGGTGQDSSEVVPELTEEEKKAAWLDETIANMTMEEKVGQMLMMDFRTNADGTPMTELSEDAAEQIEEYHLGGIILFAENLDTLEQTKALTEKMQENAEVPLFIGMDEEGGIVSRLDKSEIPHESIPSAAQMNKDPAQAEYAGREIGSVLKEIGVNVDFAPVADIFTNPENTVIGERAYGTDATTVADMASAFAKGLREEGICAAAKHFPGHGDTGTDSHFGMAQSEHDLTRLQEVEFVPFQKLIEEEIPFIMVGHIMTPNVTTDGLPASLSSQMIGILRNDLAFDGIVITDAMNMGAITEYFSVEESAKMAVKAGVDIVLMPADLKEAYEGILNGVSSGEISKEQIEESVRRILSVKYDMGIL